MRNQIRKAKYIVSVIDGDLEHTAGRTFRFSDEAEEWLNDSLRVRKARTLDVYSDGVFVTTRWFYWWEEANIAQILAGR